MPGNTNVGRSLREWRRSRGWDRQETARRLHRASAEPATSSLASLVRMIGSWERGEHEVSERYELAYRRLGWPGLQPGRGDQEADPLDRREFGTAAMGLLAGTLIAPARPPETVTAAHVRELRDAAVAVWTRDRLIGGNAQLRDATAMYRHARAMLDQSSYTGTVGADLVAVTAELACCAGFAAHDAGNQPLARALLAEAALLAAGDPLLSARAYGLLALQCNALAVTDPGRAREALRFLDAADAAAHHEPSPRVHALIWMRRAAACGVLDDDVSVRRCITGARRELDRGDHPADPPWAAFVDPAEVTAHEAMARLGQDQPQAAAALFRDVLADPGLPPRNRALYTAQLAGSLHAAGDEPEAGTAALQVLAALETSVRSARVLSELKPLREHADPGSEFAARYDAALAS
jgi:hypothetical protein